jgi:exonuclease SbcC
MITKVKLKNWRSHADTELDFSKGTNCFVGPMGSGKTSVMDAICFGLFGTFLQLQQKKLKLNDIIMKKPLQKNKAEVTVFFNVNGDEWSVKRMIENSKSTAELRKNGELVEGPQTTRVTENVEKILKMDYDLFTRAIYSQQNKLDMFLTIPRGQRMRKIDELLAIEKFEKARSTTKSVINKCSSSVKEKERVLENMSADDNVNKVETVKRELLDLNKQEIEMNEKLKRIVSKKQRTMKDVSTLKEQRDRLQKINEDDKKFKALLDVTRKDLDKIKEDLVDFAEMTMEDLKIEMRNKGEEIQKLSISLEEEKIGSDDLRKEYVQDDAKIKLIQEERIPKLTKQLKELEEIEEKLKKEPLKKLEKQISQFDKELKKKQTELQKITVKISELEQSVEELKSAGSTCPVCTTKLTPAKKSSLIENNKKKIRELKHNIKSLNPEITKLENNIRDTQQKINESKIMKNKLDELKDIKKEFKLNSDELKTLKAKLRVFENQTKMFEKNIKMIDEQLKKLKERQEAVKNIINKQEEADIKIKRIKEYEEYLTFLGIEREKLSSFSPSVLQELENEYQTALKIESEITTHLINLSSLKIEKQRLMEEIESKLKLLDKYKIEIKNIQQISEQLKFLESGLLATQEQLRKDFVLAVNQAMQSVWEELYPYKDFYSIRLSIEGGDYVLQLQDSTGWVNADGIVSGGERSMATLALRIAFSLVLAPQLKWLVLDEPTHNLDRNAVEELGTILRENISNFVDQVFLITHDPSLEEAVSGYLYRFERQKEKDEPTKVTLASGPLGG